MNRGRVLHNINQTVGLMNQWPVKKSPNIRPRRTRTSMRFDPIKALEHAELIPPGRYPGGASQEEAARVCQEFLAAQGWEVEANQILTRSGAPLAGLAALVSLWLTAGLLNMTGYVGLYAFAGWLVISVILHQTGLLGWVTGRKVQATSLSAKLKAAGETCPVVRLVVSLASQKPYPQNRKITFVMPLIRLAGLAVLIVTVNHLIHPTSSTQTGLIIIWWLGLAMLGYWLWQQFESERRLRGGMIWPENREAIGFMMELARAWAQRPSQSVALELLMLPNIETFKGWALEENIIWIGQPGNVPRLIVANPDGNDLLASVCRDLRIPCKEVPATADLWLYVSLLAGEFTENPQSVDPLCLALMAQVVHQAALRWARTRPSL